ncbi:MAG: GNAT family N-acetyltransferase [Phycisphaerae bacterium]|nr:GNAT family N-acetyltransferase [Phycisphaerae bacterium]
MSKRNQFAALRHLVGGGGKSLWIDAQAKSSREMFTSGVAGRNLLFWARRGREIQAVAMVVVSRGNVGFLYHSPPDASKVDRHELLAVVEHVSRLALEGGRSMVQSVLDENSGGNMPILEQAGFGELAELVYMQRKIENPGEARAEVPWSFRHFGQFTRQELVDVIRATYQGTLDCPRLCGVRRMEEVLASHQATGKFTPEWWLLASCGGLPAGCILVNRALHSSTAEIVYMGVVPEFRGRGLGFAMLDRVERLGRDAHIEAMRLAVDAKNTYAQGLYRRFGFDETHRRRCFAMFPERPE